MQMIQSFLIIWYLLLILLISSYLIFLRNEIKFVIYYVSDFDSNDMYSTVLLKRRRNLLDLISSHDLLLTSTDKWIRSSGRLHHIDHIINFRSATIHKWSCLPDLSDFVRATSRNFFFGSLKTWWVVRFLSGSSFFFLRYRIRSWHKSFTWRNVSKLRITFIRYIFNYFGNIFISSSIRLLRNDIIKKWHLTCRTQNFPSHQKEVDDCL